MSPTLKPLCAVLNKVGDGARGIFKTKSPQTGIGLQPFHQTAGMNV